MTPLVSSHERHCPVNFSIVIRKSFVPFVVAKSLKPPRTLSFTKQKLDRLLHRVHLFHFGPESLRYRISLQFAIRREQAILDSKRLGADPIRAHLFVVWQRRVHFIYGRLDLFRARSRDDSRQIAATISDKHYLRTREA